MPRMLMQQPMPVAPTWSHTVQPYRACQLCTNGRDAGPQRLCTCPAVTGRTPQPVELMRRPGGTCGPEALFLDFPGLQA